MTQRNAFRFNADFRVIFEDEEGYLTARVIDLSETGLFLETTMPLPEGRQVRISIVDNPQINFHEVKATVVRSDYYDPYNKVWVRPEGMAIRFHRLTHEQKMALGDLAIQSAKAA